MKLEKRPFWFGGAVDGQYFTDRENDTKRLVANFTHGVNSILISPRRWGKTSIVVKSAEVVRRENPDIRVVQMDVFSCRTPQDFCEVFAAAIIRQTASKLEEWVATAKKLLSHLNPVFSFGSDPLNDFSIKFGFHNVSEDIDAVLNLAETCAIDKGIHIIVCIDEFQQVGEFDTDLSFQRRMRGVWQMQKHVNYCLFGSKRHMMSNMFGAPSYPFYKFGDIINIERIPTEYWVQYICNRFIDTGKTISAELATEICRLVDNNSSYVQQLAWFVWNACDNEATVQTVSRSFDMLMEQNMALFEKQTEDLRASQLAYLKAMADGINAGFSTSNVISKYGLKNSATVLAAQKALESKELIYRSAGKSYFTDPLLPVFIRRTIKASSSPYIS